MLSFILVQQVTTAVLTLIPAILLKLYIEGLRTKNDAAKRAILQDLAIPATTQQELQSTTTVGFFHPYCNAGGGGERVLWTAIALLQRTAPHVVSVVYSGDGDAGKEAIIEEVKARFNIVLDPSKLHFVFLRYRGWVEDSQWLVFTLLGQSIGSMFLAWEALTKFAPDMYIDTMGYAFTFFIVHLLSRGSIPVGAYVHYPTISTDMLARVKARRQGYSNAEAISSSGVLSKAKLCYYRIFMYLYALALRRASFIMIVYPPCETEGLVGFLLEGREKIVLSVAQFRPEKDHATQLRALSELFKMHAEYQRTVKLVMLGGVRNAEDAKRVDKLKELARELGVSENVEFVVNASHADVLLWLSRASIGLSTMVDEHFGINVVELMAAGVIPVVHASGGPLNDIVVSYKGAATGYHATTPFTFASALHSALSLSPEEGRAMRKRARELAVERFSRRGFEEAWEESGWRTWVPRGSET